MKVLVSWWLHCNTGDHVAAGATPLGGPAPRPTPSTSPPSAWTLTRRWRWRGRGRGTGSRPASAGTVQYSTVQYRTVQCKCRMRKIEKIQTLDQQTAKLKAENDDLAALAGKLKEQVTFSSSVCLDSNITHNFRCTNSNKNYSGMWTTAVKLVREQQKLQSCLQTSSQATKPNLVSTKPNHCTTPRLFVSRLLTPPQFHQWRMSKDKFMKPNQINPKILYFWTTYIPIFLSYRRYKLYKHTF